MQQLAGRPTNPAEISFAASCFERVGTRVEWVVTMSAPSYPRRFSDEIEAIAFGLKTGRRVERETSPILRRVSWTGVRRVSWTGVTS